MPLDLTNLGEVAFSWWKDMPWSAACVSVEGAVAMTGAPTATFAALVAEVEAARKAAPREATPVAWAVVDSTGHPASITRARCDADLYRRGLEGGVHGPYEVIPLVRAPVPS